MMKVIKYHVGRFFDRIEAWANTERRRKVVYAGAVFICFLCWSFAMVMTIKMYELIFWMLANG